MNTVTGYCPRCGAPIYVPSVWHGIIPPPSQYSCGCFHNESETYTTTGTTEIKMIKFPKNSSKEKSQ